jgi:protein associated with RNAse G/E
MQIGDLVQVRAYKSDGTCYRWWYATVEAIGAHEIILVTPVGHRVEDVGGDWATEVAIRAFHWLDRPYSLLEAYAADGTLREIYVNISSATEIAGAQIRFTDHELDVSRVPPDAARIVDEAEFLEAALRYGYSEEFQEACYRAAREAMALGDRWVAKGMPAVEP